MKPHVCCNNPTFGPALRISLKKASRKRGGPNFFLECSDSGAYLKTSVPQ